MSDDRHVKPFHGEKADKVRRRLILAKQAISNLTRAGVSISGRKVSEETKRVCPEGRGIPRCAFYTDEGLTSLLTDAGSGRQVSTSRRFGLPAHIRKMEKLELAQKLTLARAVSISLEPSLTYLGKTSDGNAKIAELDAIIARIRSLPTNKPLARKQEDKKNEISEAFIACATEFERMTADEIVPQPTALARRADVHGSTATRFLLTKRISAQKDPNSWRAVLPHDAVMRLQWLDLAIGLFEERKYIRALRAAISGEGRQQRQQKMAQYRARLKTTERARVKASKASSVFITDLTLLGLLPANDDE